MYFLKTLAFSIAAGVALANAIPTELVKRADLKGFDISAPQSSSFWSCTYKAGYRKPVIRGYQQACGSVRSSPTPSLQKPCEKWGPRAC